MSWSRLFLYVAALACVVIISAGQVLFKLAANRLGQGFFGAFGVLAVALTLYGAATAAWILILREIQLSAIYPLMALSFVFVPLASSILLGESITPLYWAGVALLIGGLVIIGRSLSMG